MFLVVQLIQPISGGNVQDIYDGLEKLFITIGVWLYLCGSPNKKKELITYQFMKSIVTETHSGLIVLVRRIMRMVQWEN